MFKKMIFVVAICLGFVFSMQQNCFGQEKTKDELKAERDVIKTEMKSQAVIDRQAKLEKMEFPKASGIQSVDDLASNSTTILAASKANTLLIPELYKRTIGETVDGITDQTNKNPSNEELATLALNLLAQIKAVADATESIKIATDDISKAGAMQKVKAPKPLNYSKDILAMVGPELQLNLKMVNNLIATLKSANNN